MNTARVPIRYHARPPDQHGDTQPALVTFELDHQHYGLPLNIVRQVVRVPALLLLAGAPSYVCGMLNLHGAHIPVLSGRALVDAPVVCDLNNQIIIVGRANERGDNVPICGLLVDHVYDVYYYESQHITPLNNYVASALLQGVIQGREHPILLFNADALLALVPSQ